MFSSSSSSSTGLEKITTEIGFWSSNRNGDFTLAQIIRGECEESLSLGFLSALVEVATAAVSIAEHPDEQPSEAGLMQYITENQPEVFHEDCELFDKSTHLYQNSAYLPESSAELRHQALEAQQRELQEGLQLKQGQLEALSHVEDCTGGSEAQRGELQSETKRLRDKLRAVSVAFPVGVNGGGGIQDQPKELREGSKLGPLARQIVIQYGELDGVLEALLTTKRSVEQASSTSGVLPDPEARAKRHEAVEELVEQTEVLAASVEMRRAVLGSPVA